MASSSLENQQCRPNGLFAPTQKEPKLPWVETPLRESYTLSQAAGCRIFLKLENLQPSGSFKSRGIGNYILRRIEELPASPKPHIFCSSGGNAGLAAVHASRDLGLKCTVVMPATSSPLMVTKLKAAGAYEVIQHGAAISEADKHMREVVMPKSTAPAVYTPPFDHPDIWAGNSTLMPETINQLGGTPPDVIICSVGGGGLFNGICQNLDEFYASSPCAPKKETTVVAVETHGAHSLASSLAARKLITLPEITSQATSLGCQRVTPQTFDYATRDSVKSVVLGDAEAAMGCWRLADDERTMVELACGVNVALCYDGRLEEVLGRKVRKDDKVVVVLCGGSNVTVEMLAEWRERYGREVQRKAKKQGQEAEVPSDITAPKPTPARTWRDESSPMMMSLASRMVEKARL